MLEHATYTFASAYRPWTAAMTSRCQLIPNPDYVEEQYLELAEEMTLFLASFFESQEVADAAIKWTLSAYHSLFKDTSVRRPILYFDLNAPEFNMHDGRDGTCWCYGKPATHWHGIRSADHLRSIWQDRGVMRASFGGRAVGTKNGFYHTSDFEQALKYAHETQFGGFNVHFVGRYDIACCNVVHSGKYPARYTKAGCHRYKIIGLAVILHMVTPNWIVYH